MKLPYIKYVDFESLINKIDTCLPNPESSNTEKTEMHEPCGFSYTVVRSDGKYCGAPQNNCNRNYFMVDPNEVVIPVVLHNLKGSDAHHIMQEFG